MSSESVDLNPMSTAGRTADSPSRFAREPAELAAWVGEATAPIVGEDFFRKLVELLAAGLGVDTALITECPDASRNRAETLGFWHRGEFQPDIEFDLSGTPCEHVIHDGRFCYLPNGVSERFPDWAAEEGGVESFIGVPIRSPTTGEVIGHIAIYDRRPMVDNGMSESMFGIIAARAGGEIMRRRADQQRADQERLARQRLHELARVARRVSISEMTGVIAHEIRQPLTAIKTCLGGAGRYLQQSGLNDNDERHVRHGIDQALESVERAEAILQRVRNWVGRDPSRLERIDPRALIEGTASMLRPEINADRIKLTLELDESLPAVDGDPVLLEQVLFNLIRNAADAIERTEDRHGRINVLGQRRKSGALKIEVRDSGDGVHSRETESIFEPFSGNRVGGMGIGLSLCRSIIESHAGCLELASRRNPTMFRITLPAVAHAAAAIDGSPNTG